MNLTRQYYYLDVLAIRWGCTVDDLLHLGIQDQAQICINLYCIVRDVASTRMEDPEEALKTVEFINDDGDAVSLEEMSPEEQAESEAAYMAWWNRTTIEMPAGLYELGIDELRSFDMPHRTQVQVSEAYKFDGNSWWQADFRAEVNATKQHLCILHEEVVRLDKEVFAEGALLNPTVARPLARKASAMPIERTATKTLAVIAALCKAKDIDPEARSAVSDIENLVIAERLPVSSGTIRNLVKELRERDLT